MNLLWFSHPASALMMIAIPIAVGMYLTRRFQKGWRLWWIGAVAFISSQVGHIPFNIALGLGFERGWLPRLAEDWMLPFSALVLGLSAGIWEEWFRWIAYRWWAKDARSWRTGILLGSGHGGIEAILLGLLSLYSFVNIAVLHGKDLATIIPSWQLDQARLQLEGYWSMPWHLPFLGPIERIFTIPFHVASSVLVLQAFTRGNKAWVWLAVGWHALVDAICAVYLPAIWKAYPWHLYAVEGILGITALINLRIIFWLKLPEPANEEITLPLLEPFLLPKLPGIEENPENLDKTRYFT